MDLSKKKILLLGNSHLVIFGFRGEIIERLISEGFDVVVSFPNGPFGEGEKTSKEYGCRFVEVPINRRGIAIAEELKLIKNYYSLIKKEKPDVVLAYTVKCDVYGGLVCRILKIPFIANITGIGKGLAEGGLIKKILINLYRISLKKASCVFFQNLRDKQFFIDNKIVCPKIEILPGSGVNLTKFDILPYPDTNKTIFTYIARVMKAKGIEQYLEAARYIRSVNKNVEFHICGICEEDYRDVIDEEEKNGTIIYHGLVDNIVEVQRLSHCTVLPSFHPEGISNVLLEAAASGRPIITTNRVGCKETVTDGETGYLVKEQDSHDLIEKMNRFLQLSYEDRKKMGLAGRAKIQKEFDRQIVVEAYMNEINYILT